MTPEESGTPDWFADEGKVDAFLETHKGRLIEKLGLSDLFSELPAPKGAPASSGGGGQVKPQEMEGAMSSLVAALTKGVEMGATMAGAKAAADKPAPAPPRKMRKNWFFGSVEDDA